jgi:hypothetical protein
MEDVIPFEIFVQFFETKQLISTATQSVGKVQQAQSLARLVQGQKYGFFLKLVRLGIRDM